jgi:hypothetical protein
MLFRRVVVVESLFNYILVRNVFDVTVAICPEVTH